MLALGMIAHGDKKRIQVTPFPSAATVTLRFASVVAVLVVCVAFVDRPTSTWMAEHLHAFRRWLDVPTHIVDPLLPLACIGLAVAAVRIGAGGSIGPKGRVVVAACLAVAVAVLVKEQAKFLFGRLWPETWVENNPSWIGTGDYGFRPMHGGRGWASFPSGHMTVVAAPAAVLWRAIPWCRVFLALACTAVAIGLLGADYHFPADVIAGTALGIVCGSTVLALLPEPKSASVLTSPGDED